MKVENLTPEQLALEIINDHIDINTLNIKKQKQKGAAILAVKSNPKYIEKIEGENAEEFLISLIKHNYEFFVYVKKEQYTENIVQAFFTSRFKAVEKDKVYEEDDEAKYYALKVTQSLDEKLVFNYFHVSSEDDELHYIDPELEVPTSLRSSIKVSMKLVSSMTLLNKLDTHISQLGKNKIKSVIHDIISNEYKAYLYNYIKAKKIGYYTLCTSHDEIQKGFVIKLKSIFKDYGMDVTEFIIKKLVMPKDMQNKIEDLSFRIRQRREDIEADAEFAQIALENYEAKLALQEKYPNSEHSLTEYEKDLALKRYLMKTGTLKEEKVDHRIDIVDTIENADKVIEKKEIFEDEDKKNFLKNFIAWALLAAFTLIPVFATGRTTVGFILLGVYTLTFGIIAGINSSKFKKSYNNKLKIEGEDDEK